MSRRLLGTPGNVRTGGHLQREPVAVIKEHIVNIGQFRVFPPERMDTEFPWSIWAVGWLGIFKAFLWLAYEPVQPESVLRILGTKFLLSTIPLVVCAIGVWNRRKWAVWGLIAIAAANLIFFIVNPQTLNAVLVESEVRLYSIILSFITLLCNGPLGDVFILCAAPNMLKHTKAQSGPLG